MEHHVCRGTCAAVSERAGTCSAEGCTNKGEAFKQCDCGDISAHKKDESDDTANEGGA